MKKLLQLCFVFALVLSSCNQSGKKSKKDKYPELHTQAKALFGAEPKLVGGEGNEVTDAKVALGKKLYLDVRLSVDNTVSCNSCHDLNNFGVDNKQFSEGVGGKLGDRNSPTVFDAGFHFAQFWDGRAKDLEEQAGMPILNPDEMAIPNEEFLVERLSKIKEYQEMFAVAFPAEKQSLTYKNIQNAIGAFERKLVTRSKFDDYVEGDAFALTDAEKEGLQTFINVGCVACHSGRMLGGTMYQKFGLFGNYWELTGSKVVDEGRFKETGVEADKYIFKASSLRNVEKTAPYFHDGSVADLSDAVDIIAKAELNKDLSSMQKLQIVTFLKTLTGDIDESLKQQ